MTCTVDRRKRANAAAEQLRNNTRIHAVDVLAPDEGPRDEWTIEIVLARSYCPPQVHLEIGALNLATSEQSIQGEPPHSILIATLA